MLPVHDIVGSFGVFLLLLAFALNGKGLLSPTSIVYQVMNAIGAGFACFASILIDYPPFIILEGAWCAVAVIALIRIVAAQGHVQTPPPNDCSP